MAALDKMRAAGFEVAIAPEDGGLLVRPAERLTDGQRQWLAAHKADLLAALASEQPAPPPPPKLVARQTPEQRQQCFDARVAEFVRAGMTLDDATAATAKEGW